MSRRGVAIALLVVLPPLVIGGCQRPSASDEEPRRLAFLRAFPAGLETEPTMLETLRLAGFEPGRNLEVLAEDPDIAYPDPQDAAAVVGQWRDAGVDIIVASSSGGAEVARRVAPDVNVLFISNDPQATGLVENLLAPEGRLTGVTFRVPADRTLDMARRAIGELERLGLVYPGDDEAARANLSALTEAAEVVGVELIAAPFSDEAEIAGLVTEMAPGIDALVLSTSPRAVRALQATAKAVAPHSLPVIANTHLAEFALVSFYPDYTELGRQLGRQALRLLNGSSPSAVPVEDPRRFTLDVNLRVARELGLELPADLLREATQVIQ